MRFEKIPKSFFYNNGDNYEKIYKTKGLKLYLVLLKIKNIENNVYTTKKILSELSGLPTNTSRNSKMINDILEEFQKQSIIKLEKDLTNININDMIVINMCQKTNLNWFKLDCKDFEIANNLTDDELAVLFLIRAYKNNKTNTSFLTTENMGKIISMAKSTVVKTINSLVCKGLIIKKGGNPYIDENGNFAKERVHYQYVYEKRGW